ncbi:DUF2254 domain-containing protein [Desulfobacter hydrogenophilus]|uniref:DUF2254 domain-containing protein n=1 Tax=Desulfobacter hydrogenophilus TaxID=2291 RepID=A0A328FHD7_9BACT|nr:DUF2254 domain-containing protein [Desulfobacter hydrogenophilus]NDY70623.1 DUF2254 domain-containing protein [Desulfobacter hydrogenophilus]QBH13990.1 DUF2254 domain-containing protein [Desulfobacter hydrogenophilus]RAM03596.1 DUF2254 domain-containing protein [Desulfobacter hydrogenophilus]
MFERLRFLYNRIGEKLWVKPLITCVLSIMIVFLIKQVDYYEIDQLVPEINKNSVETLLSIIASSMLAIATFAVGSMVSAYNSAGSSATPRSFPLIISDDESQNALSTFIGTFIFSVIALMVLKNGYYGKSARFMIFALTLIVLGAVIVTFVRWVDSIARLGRLGRIVNKVEKATDDALQRRRLAPTLGGVPSGQLKPVGQAVYGNSIGYVQRIEMAGLQGTAERLQLQIMVDALPGTFVAPGRVLAYVTTDSGALSEKDTDQIAKTFLIGGDRTFDEDPRFGLVVLSEIAIRALSPAVNDPGTAIDVIGTLVRLFTHWSKTVEDDDSRDFKYDRVMVPEISLWDMFDDAFNAIAREGAGAIEVVVRLQKAFQALALIGDPKIREVAIFQARLALARAELSLNLPEDLDIARKATKLVGTF